MIINQHQRYCQSAKADLILWNGLNLERWFERFFNELRNVPAVVVTEGITPMPIREGAYKNNPNPCMDVA